MLILYNKFKTLTVLSNSKTLKMTEIEGKCGALLCGEASDYIRERIRPFKDTLKSIIGEHEFEYRDSSTTSEAYINTTLNIFNRFTEKVNMYCLYRYIVFKFYSRVTVLQLVSIPTSCIKAILRRSITVREHLISAKRHAIPQINIML
jgi:hypothetical protein